MDKQTITAFFDRCASTWDSEQNPNDEVIDRILDSAHIGPDSKVLDVACGTGILFPYYQQRNVTAVKGVDISPKMVEKAKKSSGSSAIEVICADIEELNPYPFFTNVVVFNAMPHFPDPAHLIEVLSKWLVPGGTLAVAHSMGIEELDALHKAHANNVSRPMLHATELQKLMDPFFTRDACISESHLYLVTGQRREY